MRTLITGLSCGPGNEIFTCLRTAFPSSALFSKDTRSNFVFTRSDGVRPYMCVSNIRKISGRRAFCHSAVLAIFLPFDAVSGSGRLYGLTLVSSWLPRHVCPTADEAMQKTAARARFISLNVLHAHAYRRTGLPLLLKANSGKSKEIHHLL